MLSSADIKATNNGAAWDGNGTPPDPYGSFPDVPSLTTTIDDTLTPTWSPAEGLFGPASFLTGTGFQFQLLDDDSPLNPDPITSAYIIKLVDADFAAGHRTLTNLDGANSITFTITKH